jgi:putative DNA primase/helicase
MTIIPNTLVAPPDQEELLEEVLNQISEIDFREDAELKNGQRLKKHHYLILAVENILKTAEQMKRGLCIKNGSVYLYNGCYWQLLEESAVQDFLGRAAERMGVDRFDARYHTYKDHLYRQFLASARLSKSSRPKGTVLINLLNGTFEIGPGGIRQREFRRRDFLTYQLPFSYDEAAEAPLFFQYLSQVLPDEEKQAIIAEYLGYVFVDQSILKLEKALLLFGSGGNGKSVLFDIINSLLGTSNVCSYSMQSLTDKSGYSRYMLGGKLLNYASELSTRLDPNIFKQLTSGEPIEVRLPYKDPAILHSYAKLLFNCNELPKDIEHTDAFFRRLLILEFDRTIPEDEQDKQLASKVIASELSGVFNWILEGLRRLMEQKRFSDCAASRERVALYKKESDSVLMFLEDNNYGKSLEKCLLLKELYLSYRSFCQEDGYQPLNCTNFRKRLEGAGVQVTRRNCGWVVFLELKPVVN